MGAASERRTRFDASECANDVEPDRTAIDPACCPPPDRWTTGPGTWTGCPPVASARHGHGRDRPVLIFIPEERHGRQESGGSAMTEAASSSDAGQVAGHQRMLALL